MSGLPKVSVVIESITARYDVKGGAAIADDLAATLEGLERQTYPRELIEAIVVLDRAVRASAATRCAALSVRALHAFAGRNYYAAQNAGVRVAGGSVVALLDGDCEPEAKWLESLVCRLEPGVAAVAGRTRYAESSRAARTLSVPGFGYVVGDESGAASGFNINNVAFDRELLLERLRRADPAQRRLLPPVHQLRADGRRVLYEPSAVVAHGVGDIRGLEFLRKHFGRGYDGVMVYRVDDRGVLRGSDFFRRFGVAALVAITGRRILRDWWWLVRHRGQIGISGASLPYFGAVAGGIRMIGFVGMITAVVDPTATRPVDPPAHARHGGARVQALRGDFRATRARSDAQRWFAGRARVAVGRSPRETGAGRGCARGREDRAAARGDRAPTRCDSLRAPRVEPRPLALDRRLRSGGRRRADVAGPAGEERQRAGPMGMFLHLCAAAVEARTVLELGSAVGISGAYLAAAPPVERLVSIEGSSLLAQVAAATIETVSDAASIECGAFESSLPSVLDSLAGERVPIDLAYIDGHHVEAATVHYAESLLPHLRRGSLVILDDITLWEGMRAAWCRLASLPGVLAAIDTGRFGLLVWDGGDDVSARRFDLARYTGWRRPGPLRPTRPEPAG